MSLKLYESDYISVVGEYIQKKFELDSSDTKERGIELQEFIHLFFTIQINGKIKTLNHYIKLTQVETENCKDLSLENWDGWYMLYNSLTDLGYPIGDADSGLGGNIINSWIDKCYIADQEKDTFHY